jgi:diguanylate cyclase (GGDEF)-like protein
MVRRRQARQIRVRGRRAVAAILVTFGLFSALGVTLSIRTTARLQHRASVVQVAARQRTLAERYVGEVLLVAHGEQADARHTASILARSAKALLDGGLAPAVPGDDDEMKLSPATGATVRAQLEQERRLVADLTAVGSALLDGRPAERVRLTAHERPEASSPVERLRVLAALTSNVSLDAARSIANQTDHGVQGLITTQVVLGALGFLVSLALGWAMVVASRRQTAAFVTERHGLEEQLERHAFYDGVTGLPNRALFHDRLEQALARRAGSNGSLAVVVADLDGFKQVNDLLGHDAGDQLLQVVATRFAETASATETVARLGGDEFALLLEGADEQTAVGMAKRLLDCISEPVTVARHELAPGASIGIVVQQARASDRKELMRRADVAMYAAKAAGRGVYAVFGEEMARDLGGTLGLEHELRLGLQRREFRVHYQPEIRLETGEVTGVEALLRWTSPTRGVVPPSQFIPLAEASGLILQLGELALRESCRQTAEWRRNGLIPETFATWVNLSGRQLNTGGISDLVEDALAEASLPASLLGLEVTETAIVAESAEGGAHAELEHLHRLGVRIAIDDFGTGFSSLAQLRKFPIDVIKVDRSFVHGLQDNPKDAAIAANVVSLAHALGLLALAEGIETEGQRAALRELGCDLAQGSLFADAAPADMIEALLRTGLPGRGALAA